ncbi:ubiquitin-like small modifier protein 1 [Sporichthya polymorpha]|uniref:ubiquitin-like small modifier protein 1 n=1 Tax=Sporichthya polymorpha TaxID=35751 RepID=UPI00038008EE|nr:ubiquitin-like small modifier protein 1 [Sporichthya polymorpha]
MIEVPVRLPAILREFAGGQAVLHVPLDGAVTVGALLDRLAAERPALERRIRDERGVLRQHVNVFVHETNVRDAGGLATEIPPGVEVLVIPAVSGG